MSVLTRVIKNQFVGKLERGILGRDKEVGPGERKEFVLLKQECS